MTEYIFLNLYYIFYIYTKAFLCIIPYLIRIAGVLIYTVCTNVLS